MRLLLAFKSRYSSHVMISFESFSCVTGLLDFLVISRFPRSLLGIHITTLSIDIEHQSSYFFFGSNLNIFFSAGKTL